MKFVTGGAFQGKHTFVREKFPQERCITVEEEQVLACLAAAEDVLSQIRAEIAEVEYEGRQAVIVMNEIGSGITPMEAEQRKLRDEMGRIGCVLADEAEEVYRVIAGIGVKIK